MFLSQIKYITYRALREQRRPHLSNKTKSQHSLNNNAFLFLLLIVHHHVIQVHKVRRSTKFFDMQNVSSDNVVPKRTLKSHFSFSQFFSSSSHNTLVMIFTWNKKKDVM